MEQISKGQIKCVKTLLGKLEKVNGAAVQDVDAIIMGFTNMRTGKVSEMGMPEATALIRHLKTLDPDEERCEKMRKKLIAMAYRYKGVSQGAGDAEKKAAIKWLDGWCEKYGAGGKVMNRCGYSELQVMVTQLEQVVKGLLNAI